MTASVEARETAQLAAQAAADKLATDVSIVDVSDRLAITDAFVLASAPNERQVQAISDEIYESLKKSGNAAARVEGYKTAEWILLDYGDFVVHVFEQKARKFYDLERLWRESKRVELPTEITGDSSSSLRRES